MIDVPAKPSAVVSVDQSNLVKEIIKSGYWPADAFTGLDALGAATSPGQSAGFTGEPLKLGLLAPLGGEVPAFGQSTVEGVQLAVKEWNAKGGVLGRQIELLVKDSQCAADPAVNAANKLVDQED